MKDVQDKVRSFNEEREWGKVFEIKDLLLNMNEEIGEFWNIIKWVDAEKQKELIDKNKEEVGNFIGDMQYLMLKIAAICNIDSEKETLKVLEEYEKRFPIDKVKELKHGNVKAGGVDNKQNGS
jgi:NTP pyrophosphatase (non-canonical NTP hydrolase)